MFSLTIEKSVLNFRSVYFAPKRCETSFENILKFCLSRFPDFIFCRIIKKSFQLFKPLFFVMLSVDLPAEYAGSELSFYYRFNSIELDMK